MENTRPSSPEKIATRLDWLREFHDLSWKEFGASINSSSAKVSNWVNGTSRLSIDGALAVRDVYGVSLDFLYLGIASALPQEMRRSWILFNKGRVEQGPTRSEGAETAKGKPDLFVVDKDPQSPSTS